MKICILTQPLEANYGGLLQAYALQTVLKRMGHEVWTEDRHPARPSFSEVIKSKVRILLGPIRHRYYPTERYTRIIRTNTDKFIHDYIRTTEPIYSNDKHEFQKYDFDTYIVGSDQVWRPRYSPYLPNYFLDFARGQNVKRIAYAASFGTDKWEFSDSQTRLCANLAKEFDAVSVREDSGVKLCADYLGINAEQVLDPTLLLERSDYIDLLGKDNIKKSDKKALFQYTLDDTPEKTQIAGLVRELLCIEPDSVSQVSINNFSYVGPQRINECVLPSVQTWIQSFIDADFVVTDSFHGTVFSIIFNKPFIIIPNSNRGQTRFSSLLKLFNLQDRMVKSLETVVDVVEQPINYNEIQYRLDEERRKSLSFLVKALM